MGPLLQKVAAGGCALMVVLLGAVQLTSATPPPWGLFLLFAGVWVFGAAMLLQRPVFGALGTAAWGVLSGVQLLLMHGPSPRNLGLAAVSWLVAAAALAFLAARRRASA